MHTFFCQYKWSFKIDLRTTEKILKYDLVQHQYDIVEETSEENDHRVVLKLGQPEIPEKDIIFKFAHERFNDPQIISSKNATMISFIPAYNNLQTVSL